MRTISFPISLMAGLLLLGTTTSLAAQTESGAYDPHHPAETEAAPPADSAPTGQDAPVPPDSMSGMGMMTPEMKQMMKMMQSMMGAGGMPGPSPAGGMMACPMMQMTGTGQAAVAMPGMEGGQAFLLGMPLAAPEEMTAERVRALLDGQLASLGNPRLKLGSIGTAEDGSITAEILTVDGSLVQKLAFNRYPGLVRQID